MLDSHPPRFFAQHETAHMIHILPVAVDPRHRRLTGARPLQIRSVAAAPFPRVCEIDHGTHATPFQLGHETVEPRQQRVVVFARSRLKHGTNVMRQPLGTFGARKHAQVVEPERMQRVELGRQSVIIAPRSVGCQYRTIPEIGALKAVFFIVKTECAVRRHRNEW